MSALGVTAIANFYVLGVLSQSTLHTCQVSLDTEDVSDSMLPFILSVILLSLK